MSVNKAIILGNVGKDPIIRTTEAGMIASFTVATTESYTDREGDRRENTEWHNVACFGRLADLVRDYVRSGMRLYIEGKITSRSWDDKEGQKHYMTEIRAQYLEMLSPKDGQRQERYENPRNAQPAQNTQRAQTRKSQPAPADYDLEPKSDDLPF